MGKCTTDLRLLAVKKLLGFATHLRCERINVIENLWSVLNSRVNKKLPKTADDLWIYAEEEWVKQI